MYLLFVRIDRSLKRREEYAMKKILMTAGLAVAMAAGHAMPASAMNKEWAAVAGFVGGVLVANAANCNTRTYYQPAPVVYHEAPRHVVHYEYQAPPRGYYEYRTERVWVPGSWSYEYSSCGSRRNVWQPGYYETHRNKVWVSQRGGRHHRYDY